MEALREEVLAIVLAKLKALNCEIDDDAKTYLQMLVIEVEQYIMNYCNISEIPCALRFVWANLVVDYYRWINATHAENETPEGGSGSITVAGKLASIREGDTTITLATVSSGVSSGGSSNDPIDGHNVAGILDNYVLNYKDSLNKFRRIVW